MPADADLADVIAGLNGRIGLPQTLRQMGVPRDVLPSIARNAVADHCTVTNPRLADAGDYERLLDAAFD